MQKNITVLFAVAVLAVGFATPAYAAPQGACSPWPACKDDPQGGEVGGESTCNTEYLGITDETVGGAATGPCTDMQDPPGSCDLVRPNDTGAGWRFTEDCQTSDTLVIDPNDIINGEDHILKLVGAPPESGPWNGGRAAIINFRERATVRDLTITVEDPAVADCDRSSPVEAAISFDTLGLPSSVPGLVVRNVVVTVANDAQFCNAIEYVSDDAEDELSFFPGGIRDSEIGENSYSNFGILVTNINTSDSNTAGDNNNVGITGNVVHSSQNGCVGIQVGPWVERADIEDNDVDVPVCGGSGGVGISVLTTGVARATNDPFLAPRPANLVGNIVDIGVFSSATARDVGISIVDSAIDKNQENAISGFGGDVPYVVCNSGTVSFPTKGKKKNTFNLNGTTTTIIAATCP